MLYPCSLRLLFAVLLGLAGLCAACTTAPAPEPEIIAHRGASYDAPENTLASANLGWEQGADAVEIDIRLSTDSQIVLLHDPTLLRTGGLDRPVTELTLEELRRLDVGRFKGESWAEERIPTLDEVLPTVPAGKRLFVEIKTGPEILPALQRTLEASSLAPEQVVLIGFGHETMAAAKERMPAYQMYWLSSMRQDEATGAWSPTVDELIARTREAGVEGLNVRATEAVDEAFVRKVKDAGLQCFVWTVNDADVARRLQAAGVDGITTDRPGWLREQLRQPAGQP